MNTQNNAVLNKKIEELRTELNELGEQIEKERVESSEDDPSLQELLDKKEFLLGQIEELENPDEHVMGDATCETGQTYTVEFNGKTTKLTIVIPAESDPSVGNISCQSPLAIALKGKKAGDKVEVSTPAGKILYKIKAVGK